MQPSIRKIVLKGSLVTPDQLVVRFTPGTYKVGGQVVTLQSEAELVIDPADQLGVAYVYPEFYVARYQNVDDATQMLTVTEYLEQLHGIDVRDEDGNWPSIRERHAYELFVAQWRAVRESSTVELPVFIETVDNVDKRHPHPAVTQLRKLTGDVFNTQYTYLSAVHAFQLVSDLLTAAGFASIKFERFGDFNKETPTPSFGFREFSLEFAKVRTADGDTYLTSVIPALKPFEKAQKFTSTWDEVVARFEANDAEIRRSVTAWLNRSRLVKSLDTTTVGELQRAVEAALTQVRQVSPMKSSSGAHRSAMDELVKLRKLIQAASN